MHHLYVLWSLTSGAGEVWSLGQKAAIAVEFLPALAEESRGRMARPGDPRRGSNTSPAPGTQASGDGHRARDDAGALVEVSGATVDRADRAPDLLEAPELDTVVSPVRDQSRGWPVPQGNSRLPAGVGG